MTQARWPQGWPENLVVGLDERWSQATHAPSPRLLRLSILRELSRAIHAARSSILAGASATSMNELRRFEETVDALRLHDALDRTLRETLLHPPVRAQSAPTGVGVPMPLRASRVIGPGKLERSDRQWELALAREAETRGYSLHAIEATLPMREVEAWSTGLDRELWPRAVVLFTESGATPSAVPSNWTGRWWTCFEPTTDASALVAALRLRPTPQIIPLPEPP